MAFIIFLVAISVFSSQHPLVLLVVSSLPILGFLYLIRLTYLLLRSRVERTKIDSSFIIDCIKDILKNRSSISRTAVNSGLSNERSQLAENQKKEQEKFMLYAEALYLNPWNEQALSQILAFTIKNKQDDFTLLIADVFQEGVDLWRASLLRFMYLYKKFSESAKNTPSSSDLPVIQRNARSFVEEGKKLLGFAETEEKKDVLLDVLLQLATAYAVLENKTMVNEMMNRAVAENPTHKLDYEDKRGGLLHLAEGELRRLVAIQDEQHAIDEQNVYDSLQRAKGFVRREIKKARDDTR